MHHDLKIRKCFADAIVAGDKTFEVRFNCDRGFQKGDTVNFHVFENKISDEELAHPIGGIVYEITYVLSGYGLDNQFVAFSFREI
jgi:hypothetical protein